MPHYVSILSFLRDFLRRFSWAFLLILFVCLPSLARAVCDLTNCDICVTTEMDEYDGCGMGLCSLREAIEEANLDPALSRICFAINDLGGDIGVQVISPTSTLPEIISPVTIDGFTQAGALANTLEQGNN
ncbi:MAG: CSLREA domain-containing protein, partial [Deltaproteobacteria bacterium]|nr:CSLREA domain-containing protein [Deltaproteobacteria bacterium]